MMIVRSFKSRGRRAAFTLIELLTVLAIISVLSVLIAPSVSGMLGASNLDSGGNMVVDLANQARQNSMSKGVMTALVMVTNSSHTDWNYRVFTLLQLAPGATSWVQASKWYSLPRATLIDSSESSFITQQATLPAAFGTLTYAGNSIDPSTCSYQIFTPTGQISVKDVSSAAPPTLRVKQANGATANYYNITLNVYTGLPTIDRP